jgi:nifR3 family TIM-barrel protein
MVALSAVSRPLVILAPMAGVTDLPFRNLVRRFGSDAVVSEMVASQEVVQGKPDMRARAELGLGAADTIVQLAGRDAPWMAEAARMVSDRGARRIDINMGCPARKVVGGLSGSALMRDLDHAEGLIAATVEASGVPVSVKMRLGWDDASLNAPELARRAESAGATMITVHGRTRCQFYEGRADWVAIAAVARAVRIPVIANGDIVDAASARIALRQSAAAGVMVGRGARGRPWLLAEIAAGLRGESFIRPAGLADIVADHYEAALAFHGPSLGARTMRKHLGWYLDAGSAPGGAARAAILRETDPGRVIGMVRDALGAGAALAA